MAASDARELTEEEFQQLSQEERVEYARRVADRFTRPSWPNATERRIMFTRLAAGVGTTVLIMLLLWGAIVVTRRSMYGPEPPRPKKQTGLFGAP